eukprot:4484952-Lingulodinium_polyedra.AAC.1
MGPDWVAAQTVLWNSLGVEAEVAVILARDLEYEFTGGRMWVSKAAADTMTFVEKSIHSCLFTAMRFVKWSDSRWLTVGVCSRIMVAALALGVEDLVTFISLDERPSLFYLNGFNRLEPRGKNFMVQASMVSRVSEGVLAELMSDARVALRYPDLWQCLAEDMAWLMNRPDSLWHSLSAIAETTKEDLQTACLRGAHISFHFVWRRFLQDAGQLPWSLCRGDIAANLDALEEGPEPEDPVSKKLWQLATGTYCPEKGPYSRRKLIATIKLLGECPWTTLPCEQLHGSLAIFRRWHPEYGTESLLGRAFMHQFNRVISPSVSKTEQEVHRLAAHLRQLSTKNPDKVTGFNQWVSTAMGVLKAKAGESDPAAPADDETYNKVVMSRAGIVWATMEAWEKAALLNKARASAIVKKEAQHQEYQALLADHQKMVALAQEEGKIVPPLMMSACQVGEQYLNLFEDLCQSQEFTKAAVMQQKRDAAFTTPKPLSQARMATLKEYETWAAPHPEMPPWARAVAKARDAFTDTILQVQLPGQEKRYYKFLYAVISPTPYLALSPLELQPMAAPSTEPVGWHNLSEFNARHRQFRVNYANLTSGSALVDVPEGCVAVIEQAIHRGGTLVTSSCLEEPLTSFLQGAPDEAEDAEPQQKKQRVQDPVWEQMLIAMPWLAHLEEHEGYTGKKVDTSKGAASGSADMAEEGSEEEENEDGDDVAQCQVLAALDEARAALSKETKATFSDFRSYVQGGSGLEKAKGKQFDNVIGVCRGAAAKAFMRRHHENDSFRNAIATHTIHGAAVLCNAWCHRCQFYKDLEATSPLGEGLIFGQEHHAQYKEPDDLIALLARPDCPAATRNRAKDLREVFVL